MAARFPAPSAGFGRRRPPTWAFLLLWCAGGPHCSQAAEPTPAGDPPAVEKLSLATSDGVALAAWYYAVDGKAKPKATVLLIHDLEGSHETVEPLAKSLQAAGFAVVAPDLRGHGGSTNRVNAGRGGGIDAASLRKPDLLAVAASGGGRIREQASLRGDLETVRDWIRRQTESGSLDIERLCIVGSGAGATLGTMWAVADATWPPTTSGPQGGTVRALAMISPEVSTKGGVSILPTLKTDLFRQSLPVLVVAGAEDRDSRKIFDQLKAMRPKEWILQGPGQKRDQADGIEKAADASLFCVHVESSLSADELAADIAASTASIVTGFLELALDR